MLTKQECEGNQPLCSTAQTGDNLPSKESFRTDASQLTLDEQLEAGEMGDTIDEAQWATEQAAQQATANVLAMAEYKPGTYLNRNVKNPRGFYETEVNMEFTGSHQEIAEMLKSKKFPALGLDASARNFELPDTPVGQARTKMHAQGNIYLSEIRSTFKTSLLLTMSDRLRGVKSGSSTSHLGKRGHYLALPNEHKTFDNPKLLVESEPGKMTTAYVKTYPEYLKGTESLMKSIQPIEGNSKFYLVKMDSPIVAMVNMARIEGNMPELVPDESAKLLGKMVVDKEEVNNAVEQLKTVMKSDVNYVKLYDALKVRIDRPFVKSSMENQLGDEWLDTHELDIKSNAKSDAAAALSKKASIHLRLIVEHKPHAKDGELATSGKQESK